MKETVTAAQLADALGTTKKTVLAQARAQGWAYVRSGNAMRFVEGRLPADVRFALAARRAGSPAPARARDGTGAGRALAGDAFLMAGRGAQEAAQWRCALIREQEESGLRVADFIALYNRREAGAHVFRHLGPVSQTTFYRWRHDWERTGASGVVPKYGMSRGGAGESLGDEERDLLRRLWLRNTQPTAMHAWRLMRELLPYSRCSYQTALRYLGSIPKAVAGYHRLGAARFENLFLPHMEQDIERYRSLEVVVSDHHCVDCVVTYHGRLVRPWLTTFQDLRSGKVLGWCPSVKPSSMSIVVAYYMCCISHGVPQAVLFDNGQDYRSKWLNGWTQGVTVRSPEGIDEEKEVEFRGVFATVGSDVRFTRTYNGKSKARQERYFRIIGEYLAKEMGSYVGSDTKTRPEDAQLYWRAVDGRGRRNDLPDYEDFVRSAGAMIAWINGRMQSHGAGMRGRTRDEVFAACLPPEDEIVRPTAELLQKALLKGEVRRVWSNGVRVGGVSYWNDALFAHSGTDILVYRNPLSADEVTCTTVRGQPICRAVADYFKETGDLGADIGRLDGTRGRLTAIAEQGSGEVGASPETRTMIDVAARMYGGGELTQVDRFLLADARDGADAGGKERTERRRAGGLRSPIDGEGLALEA